MGTISIEYLQKTVDDQYEVLKEALSTILTLEVEKKQMKRQITFLELGENETQQGARVLFSNCLNHLQHVEVLLLEGDVETALRYIKATVEEETDDE